MAIPVNRSVSKGMRNTEHLWSYQMVKIIETGCIENSDRVACSTINTLLHREGEQQTLKLRTMADLCDRHGHINRTGQMRFLLEQGLMRKADC